MRLCSSFTTPYASNLRRAFVIVGSLFLLVSCADNKAEDAPGECPCRITTASITIDGSFEDWNGIDPVLTDSPDDAATSGVGGDLENIYLAKNGDNLYVRFEVWYDSADATNDYSIWFDNNEDHDIGDVEDRLVHLQNSTVTVENGDSPPSTITVTSANALSGSNIELSLSISELGLTDRFMLGAYIRDASGNELDYNDQSVTVKND